jgi:hypothetical protein
MKYMLQVRFNRAAVTIDRLPAPERESVFAEFEAIRESPGVLDGNQLQPVSAATTVRVHNRKTHVTEGPAVDTSAALDGYYVYDGPDLEAAIALAARIPVARFGGTSEVRPIFEAAPRPVARNT